MYTKFKITNEELQARIKEVKESILDNDSAADVKGVLVSTVMYRLAKGGLRRYLDYGIYWWALKKALANNEHDFGGEYDDEILKEYSGKDDIENIILADMFRDYYLENFALGTREFLLNEEGDATAYYLNDEYLENMLKVV